MLILARLEEKAERERLTQNLVETKNEMKMTNNELNDLQHLFGVDVDPHDSYDVKREAAAQGIRVVMRKFFGCKSFRDDEIMALTLIS